MSDRFHRKNSLRLHPFDYSHGGAYFLTLVTYKRIPLFGSIRDENTLLSAYGRIVHDTWSTIPNIRKEICLGDFVIMPNHLHGIVYIIDEVGGATCRTPLPMDDLDQHQMIRLLPHSIGSLVAGFKSASAREINQLRGEIGKPVWQRGYYDHIIRNDADLRRIQEYIQANPINWISDPEYTK